MMKKIIKIKGFTLVEMLVAVSIISLSILAGFTAVSNSMKSSSLSDDKIVAQYLASEAIEIIRNIRDNNAIENIRLLQNALPSIHWLYGIAETSSDPCGNNKFCIVDSLNNTLTSCGGSASSCPYLRKNSTTKLYGYDGSWPVTVFRRSVTVIPISASEYTITATVDWTDRGQNKSFTLKENINNWQ